jgi:predicted MFS family arabinose efflux permease
MQKKRSNYRWFVISVFFVFMWLHQSDKLLIGPLTTPIMNTFKIDTAQMGLVFTGAAIVAALFYLVWGYLYDRYARPKLLALASFIWGSTTWLSALAPTFPIFFATRATTGVDDSSYPGLFSLIADYFGPAVRGKVYGVLQLTQPLGYMTGLFVATLLGGMIGWRSIFFITGSLGILLSFVIFFGIKEVPRGRSEPEMQDLDQIGVYKFDRKIALGLFKKRSLLFLFAQGFVGVFPWEVITYWIFRYLETERGYNSDQILITMVPAILVLSSGYFVGGAIGDYLFKRTPRGRMITSLVGVLTGAVLLFITLNIPVQNFVLFMVMLMATALFIPFASANVISTVYDITLPEVRGTALAIESFIESIGAALAPAIAGFIARDYSLQVAFLSICTTAWLLGSVFLAFTAYLVPHDIETLRGQMRERAEFVKRVVAAGTE